MKKVKTTIDKLGKLCQLRKQIASQEAALKAELTELYNKGKLSKKEQGDLYSCTIASFPKKHVDYKKFLDMLPASIVEELLPLVTTSSMQTSVTIKELPTEIEFEFNDSIKNALL